MTPPRTTPSATWHAETRRPFSSGGEPVASTLTLHINAVGAVMGGAARHLGRFVDAVVAQRPLWSVVVHVSESSPVGPFAPGVETHSVPGGQLRRLWWDGHMAGRWASREGAAALVNLTNYGPFRSPVPSILFQRNPVYFDPSWVSRMDARSRAEAAVRRRLAFSQLRGASVVVTPSEAMAGYLKSWKGFPETCRLHVVPHAVDLDLFAPADGLEGAASSNGTGPRSPVRILSVSHGAPHKGQELLVDILAELRRRGVEAQVQATIDKADFPGHADRLCARAEGLGVADRLHLLGRVSDVERLYRACDVFLFPSVTESFGFPVLEAMASGVPIVASEIASTVELLGDAGWYFRTGDAAGAADQVVSCLGLGAAGAAGDGERVKRVAKARARAEELTWDRNAAEVISLIEELARV